jgi:hypothetical protein
MLLESVYRSVNIVCNSVESSQKVIDIDLEVQVYVYNSKLL